MTSDSDPYRTPAEVGEEATTSKAKSRVIAGAAIVFVLLGGFAIAAVMTLRTKVQEFGEMRRGPPVPRDIEIATEEDAPSSLPLTDGE